MTEQQQQEIRDRLIAACDTTVIDRDAVIRDYRERLAGGWRTDLAERLSR
ncbi:MAG TPA: hypothetical protein VGF17_06285 [Phytomonospora sp.]